MPTVRAFTFLTGALILYFLANQTQVGWLYVTAALLAAVVPTAWWLGRGVLRHVEAECSLSPESLHEGNEARVCLRLHQNGRPWLALPASLVRTVLHCPLAAPASPHRRSDIFVPSIPAGKAVELNFDVEVYRRGLYPFPPLLIRSRAPFGLFRRQRSLPLATSALVYPEVRNLRRLPWLDARPTPERPHARAGRGSEVLGVRPYRHGDSLRHVHWRSVARRRQLMTKEFADEAQTAVTLALDLQRHPYPPAGHKHTPFEWAMKVATSIGDYARRRGYTLELVGDDEVLAAPAGPLSWHAFLEYLARVQPEGERPLADLLTGQAAHGFLVAILPWPDHSVVSTLRLLQRQGRQVLAVLLDPRTFPLAGHFPESPLSATTFAAELDSLGVSTRVITYDEERDWTQQLAELAPERARERTQEPLRERVGEGAL